MYYHNSSRQEPHLVFIGRWNPFHAGHKAMIQKVMQTKPGIPILVLVRDTSFDEVTVMRRALHVWQWMYKNDIKGRVTCIPDIEGVYYGRKVGYNVEKVNLDPEMEKISGTDIRNKMVK